MCWSRNEKKEKREEAAAAAAEERLAVASDWLLNSLTTLDATELLDCATDQATLADPDAYVHTGLHRNVCERVAKLPDKLGRLHAAKV